jgi:hypothetical protein
MIDLHDADADVDARLRCYAPLAPPARLRARVLAPAGRLSSSRRTWWIAAAATLVAVTFHLLASATYAEVRADISRADDIARSQRIERLAADLGGSAAARAAAVRIVTFEEQMTDRPGAMPENGDRR